VKDYQKGAKEFLAWITDHHYDIESMRYSDLLYYIKHSQQEGKGKGNAYIRHRLIIIRHYFNFLVSEGKMQNNPAQGLYIRGKAKRLPHDLVDYSVLREVYDSYLVTDLRSKRDKVILGLLIFQAMTIEELEKLQPEHIHLRAGKIAIPGTGSSNTRVLKLDGSQVMELQEYLTHTREEILKRVHHREKISQLLMGMRGSLSLGWDITLLMKRLHHPSVKRASQIRASTIAEWTRKNDVRVVQYMSGHKYVSTTEKYQATHLEDLQEQLRLYHPLK
jgi:integrase/recombinase XerD